MIKERAIDASTISVTVALVVLAWWLAGYERDQVGASAARPGPTVTVSASPTPTRERPAPRPTPVPSPSRSATGATVVVAVGPTPHGAMSAGAVDQPQPPASGSTGSSGGSASSPTSAPRCSGIAAVQLLRRCALTVGGNR